MVCRQWLIEIYTRFKLKKQTFIGQARWRRFSKLEEHVVMVVVCCGDENHLKCVLFVVVGLLFVVSIE
jgi:hypothetical protein